LDLYTVQFVLVAFVKSLGKSDGKIILSMKKIKRITFAENFEYFMYAIVEYLVFVSDCAVAYMDADKTDGKRTKNNKE
jgi:hypothetical protein